MLIYLIKSSICMIIMFSFYKIFLELESFHNYKRFYLLSTLLLSLFIPSITFTEYIESSHINQHINYLAVHEENIEPVVSDAFHWTNILFLLYIIGVIFFSIKFIFNLYKISRVIKQNTQENKPPFFYILVKKLKIPHTFFMYIFLNEKAYYENTIPKEVILHEETHALQKHSLDIILVELIKIFLWFNPFIYLFKNAIKLNHEFLADRAVINKGAKLKTYRQILLTFSSNTQNEVLVNSINYSSIKKRFNVMKKQTSQKMVWLKSLIILPLLSVLIYFLSEKTYAYQTNAYEITANIEEGNKLIVENKELNDIGDLKNLLQQKLKGKEVNKNEFKANVNVFPNTPMGFITDIKEIFLDEGIKNINVIPSYSNKMHQSGSNKAASITEDINLFIDTDKKLYLEKKEVLLKDLTQKLKEIIKNYSQEAIKIPAVLVKTDGEITHQYLKILSKEIKKAGIKNIKVNAGSYIIDEQNFTSDVPITEETIKLVANSIVIQDKNGKINEETINEYNKLAKKYTPHKNKNIHFNSIEVERLTYLYSLMDEKQRKNAEPFPDIHPPTAPAPPAPHTSPAQKNVKVIKAKIPVPPAPPAPLSPLDHVRDMARKGAKFLFQGKSISGEEAIEILKNNKHINLVTKHENSKQPVVKISLAP